MIVNRFPAHREQFQTAQDLSKLEKSNHQFRLTGSRLFGRSRDDSDWDFFAERTPELEEYLIQEGYTSVGADHYLHDRSIACVFSKGYIQVQLVKDADLKERAQELLLHLPPPMYSAFLDQSKRYRKFWWEWAMNLAAELPRDFQNRFI